MKSYIELNSYEALDLLNALKPVTKSVGSVRKLRIAIEGGQVKFKVNEHMWSPPMGKEIQAQ